MRKNFDVVVVGGGVVGASTAFHLKKLGARSVLLLEAGQICSGGTAKSCAICRSHYSIATNTILTLKTLEMFRHFRDWLEDDEAESGFVNSGYLILSRDGEMTEQMQANLDVQTNVGAATTLIEKEEAHEHHPLLNLDDVGVIGYEPHSGFADPYLTTASFARAAHGLGVEVRTETPVEGLLVNHGRVIGVRTAGEDIHSDTVISAVGPWTPQLLDAFDLDLHLEISRHIVMTLRAADAYGFTLPIVKDLTTENKMYFRPSSGGVVLLGTGDHGDSVDGPEHLDENVSSDFVSRQGERLTHRMPSFADAVLIDTWVGPYDITPDWNPVLGAVPGVDGLIVAYGFSGHGFKLGPALGRVLAQVTLGLSSDVDISAYSLARFGAGRLLTGNYGIGSIS